jgi:hypothetical protein
LSIDRTEEWTSSPTATRVAARPSWRARSRAATSAERLPFVPPCTKQPPAPSGKPASDASHASASFSAWTAPEASSHEPP